jgi:DNA polymerase
MTRRKPSLTIVPAEPAAPRASAADGSLTVVVRGIREANANGVAINVDSADIALTKAIELDVSKLQEPIITWGDTDIAVALDIDRPDGADPLRPVDVDRLFPASLPRPLAAWSTHGGGLRAIFVSVGSVLATMLAGVWALLSPLGRFAGWRMEALPWTRHPRGARGDERCGRVRWFVPSADMVVPGDRAACVASDDQVRTWLEDNGLAFGRYPTPNCPLCSTTRKSSGSDPIVINERGINCFKCSKFKSWDHLVGVEREDSAGLRAAARALVHFPHQKHVLHDRRPAVPVGLLRPAWAHILRDVNRDRLAIVQLDAKGKPTENPWIAKVKQASGETIDLVRSASGAWLDDVTLAPRKVTKATAAALPGCLDGIMTDKVLDVVPLTGFAPIVAINADTLIGPHFRAADGAVVVRRQANGGPGPVDVRTRPLSATVEAAWASLTALLPGLNRSYLSGLVTASMLAQRAEGPPPILVVTGDTGSAKTASQYLAGSMIGGGAVNITFGRDADSARRSIGLALEKEGASLLFVDEIGRVPDLYEKLATVFELGSTLRYAAKYHNEYTTRVTAPLSILGSTMPELIVNSPELSRRAVGWRLTVPGVGWRRHGDIKNARHVEALRAPLDVVVAELWWRVFDLGPTFDWCALCLREFGAVELQDLNIEDSGAEGLTSAVRALYQMFIEATPEEMTTCGGRDGWLNANPGTHPFKVIEEIVDTEADHRRTASAVSELERLSLAAVLGFTQPPLKLLVRRRSARWFVKFVEIGVRKGAETPRNQLPQLGPAVATNRGLPNTASGLVAPDASDALTATSSTPAVTTEVQPPAADKVSSEDPGASGATDGHAAPKARARAVVVHISHRSIANLSEVGGVAYARHAHTEVLHVAAAMSGRPAMSLSPSEPLPQAISDALAAGAPVAAYDALRVQQHLWTRLGWPQPARWIDTLALMRIAGLPADLASAADALDPPVEPAPSDAVPRALTVIDPRAGALPAVGRREIESVAAVGAHTATTVRRLARERLSPWIAAGLAHIEVDARINERGFAFDSALADAVLDLADRFAREARDGVEVDGGVLASPERLRAFLQAHGLDLPDVRHATLAEVLDDPDVGDIARQVINARLATASIVANKLRAGLRHVGPDGRIRWSLVFGAAHTGRWGGRGFQPQNLPRGHAEALDVQDLIRVAREGKLSEIRDLAAAAGLTVDDALATLVRPCVWAGPGRRLAVADYASIEARALRWLAGDDVGLEAFRTGVDLYRLMAAKLFSVELDAVTGSQRQLGKATELGSGFGMGPERLKQYAETFGVDWAAVGLTANQAVEAWRDANSKIAGLAVEGASIPHRDGGLWKLFDRAARRAASNGDTSTVGRCTWRRSGSDVLCRLPSGRDLVYRNARVEDVERLGKKRPTFTYQRGRARVSTFGGKLVENVTQAVCRDLLAESLLRLDAEGHRVVLHVHDEVVCEVDGDEQLSDIMTIMETPPSWAEELPMRVVGHVQARYGK